jgi:hypothetical protein
MILPAMTMPNVPPSDWIAVPRPYSPAAAMSSCLRPTFWSPLTSRLAEAIRAPRREPLATNPTAGVCVCVCVCVCVGVCRRVSVCLRVNKERTVMCGCILLCACVCICVCVCACVTDCVYACIHRMCACILYTYTHVHIHVLRIHVWTL